MYEFISLKEERSTIKYWKIKRRARKPCFLKICIHKNKEK